MIRSTDVFLVFCGLFFSAHGDPFTSIERMKKIPDLERDLIDALERQLIKGQALNSTLGRMLAIARANNAQEGRDRTYVENPINAFHFLKRVTYFWEAVVAEVDDRKCRRKEVQLTNSDDNYEFCSLYQDLHRDDRSWPRRRDVEGSALALTRLATVYDLDIGDLVQGKLHFKSHGVERILTSKPLMILDVRTIADVSLKHGSHYEALVWYNELLHIYDTQSREVPAEVYVQMAEVFYHLEYFEYAFIYSLRAFWKDIFNRKQYQLVSEYRQLVEYFDDDNHRPVVPRVDPECPIYTRLCRGEDVRTLQRGTCEFGKTSIPFIRGKIEYLHKDPLVALYHDVISEEEMTMLKQRGFEVMHRSRLGNFKKRRTRDRPQERISQSGWVSDNIDVAKRLSTRVELLTGLSTLERNVDTHAEPYQVLNYGLGGMFECHIDGTATYRSKGMEDIDSLRNSGNRVATWMFYMSDVEAGGATVFTHLNIRVPVIKGAAAFWYNLLRNGEEDPRTMHAGCPVLVGSKWVANKWFREIGQQSVRPCLLNPDS